MALTGTTQYMELDGSKQGQMPEAANVNEFPDLADVPNVVDSCLAFNLI